MRIFSVTPPGFKILLRLTLPILWANILLFTSYFLLARSALRFALTFPTCTRS
jgi:hypothetical protein